MPKAEELSAVGRLEKKLGELAATLTSRQDLKTELKRTSQECERLAAENARLTERLSQAELARIEDLQGKIRETEVALRAMADMRSRLDAYPRDWWIGLECITRAERCLREHYGVNIGPPLAASLAKRVQNVA